jgi:hypothetical protein
MNVVPESRMCIDRGLTCFSANSLSWVARLLALSVLLISGRASAQQTYFNVPNAELATAGEAFVQQQLQLGRRGEAGLTADFGMTEYLEFGFNILSLPLFASPDMESGQLDPSALVNAQMMFSPASVVHLQVGTRQGIASGTGEGPRAAYSAFGHALVRFGKDDAPYGNYVMGAYVGTRASLGEGSLGGGLLGFEVPLIGPRLRAVGDWVIGTNEASVVGLGIESILDAKGRWDLALGAQLPSPRSGNDYALIVQIAWLSRGSN